MLLSTLLFLHLWVYTVSFQLSRSAVFPLKSLRRGRVASRFAAAVAGKDADISEPPYATKSYVRYPIYKGKAALSVRPVSPTFTPISGASGARTLSKEGGMLFEFALASGQRVYDWANKGSFLLDVGECGAIISMEQRTGSAAGLEFVHDPNMGGEKQGEVTKRLKLAPAADGDSLFLSLQVKDKGGAAKQYSLPLTGAEFCVLRHLIQFSLPRFVGFDCIWGSDNAVMSAVPVPPPPQWAPLADE